MAGRIRGDSLGSEPDWLKYSWHTAATSANVTERFQWGDFLFLSLFNLGVFPSLAFTPPPPGPIVGALQSMHALRTGPAKDCSCEIFTLQ
jgi:hypothetical protein